jgi:steroid delta-isomerase-like uncharacterized protein
MRQQYRSFVAVVILLGLFIGCGSSPTSQTEVNKAVVRRITEALNNGSLDLLDELMTPDFVRHCQATPDVQVCSREDFKRFTRQYAATFPDAQITNQFLVAEGDKVAAYATYIGTQTGPLGPFPPSRKKVESKFLGIFRLEEGKIAELWVEWDNLAMLIQLGHFPPPAKGKK